MSAGASYRDDVIFRRNYKRVSIPIIVSPENFRLDLFEGLKDMGTLEFVAKNDLVNDVFIQSFKRGGQVSRS